MLVRALQHMARTFSPGPSSRFLGRWVVCSDGDTLDHPCTRSLSIQAFQFQSGLGLHDVSQRAIPIDDGSAVGGLCLSADRPAMVFTRKAVSRAGL